MKEDFDFLIEWAVWGHLDSKTDLELVLLKGHLLIETVLESALERNEILGCEDYSFFRKNQMFKKIEYKNVKRRDFIHSSLDDLNKIRNKLAHEFHFNINNGDFEVWAAKILNNLKGEKFTKYTYRTKIVHAFSIISINMLELY